VTTGAATVPVRTIGSNLARNSRCAAPSWAAVGWVWSQSTNPFTHKAFKTNGLSILEIKKGKITRETIYYERPGR
jgi:hypothetical protein